MKSLKQLFCNHVWIDDYITHRTLWPYTISWEADDKHIAVVPETRKNKRGRIAWRRDGVCWECATKRKAPVEVDE